MISWHSLRDVYFQAETHKLQSASEWSVEHVASAVANIGDSFGEYGKLLRQKGVGGAELMKSYQLPSAWALLGVKEQSHAQRLANFVKALVHRRYALRVSAALQLMRCRTLRASLVP